jgi:hypothetical protein
LSGIFRIVPKLHHNAAVPKSSFCKFLNWKYLVGAWRFELQASCAQGRRATRLRYAPTFVTHHSTAVYGFVFMCGKTGCAIVSMVSVATPQTILAAPEHCNPSW